MIPDRWTDSRRVGSTGFRWADNVKVWVCNRCACWCGDYIAHARWHDELDRVRPIVEAALLDEPAEQQEG